MARAPCTSPEMLEWNKGARTCLHVHPGRLTTRVSHQRTTQSAQRLRERPAPPANLVDNTGEGGSVRRAANPSRAHPWVTEGGAARRRSAVAESREGYSCRLSGAVLGGRGSYGAGLGRRHVTASWTHSTIPRNGSSHSAESYCTFSE